VGCVRSSAERLSGVAVTEICSIGSWCGASVAANVSTGAVRRDINSMFIDFNVTKSEATAAVAAIGARAPQFTIGLKSISGVRESAGELVVGLK
jgi:hypothetical protein